MVTFNNLEFIAPCKIQNDDCHSLLQSIPYKSLLLFIYYLLYITIQSTNQPTELNTTSTLHLCGIADSLAWYFLQCYSILSIGHDQLTTNSSKMTHS